ncbi:MAG: hypothetical protein WEC76_00780 [Steroidobacteraceae bacterium]
MAMRRYARKLRERLRRAAIVTARDKRSREHNGALPRKPLAPRPLTLTLRELTLSRTI